LKDMLPTPFPEGSVAHPVREDRPCVQFSELPLISRPFPCHHDERSGQDKGRHRLKVSQTHGVVPHTCHKAGSATVNQGHP
jgi:hypothetical protein